MIRRPKPTKILFLILLSFLIFLWLWCSLRTCLTSSNFSANLNSIRIVLVPIIPLAAGMAFFVIISIMQDFPTWSRWLLASLIGTPVFFISTPPNTLALIAAFLTVLSAFWMSEKLKAETEDHLRVRIFSLSQSGSVSIFLTIILVTISLLAVAQAKPSLEKKKINLPRSWFEANSPIVKFISGFVEISPSETANQSSTSQTIADYLQGPIPLSGEFSDETIEAYQAAELKELSEQLGIPVSQNDTAYDIVRKSVEQKINAFYQSSPTAVLFLYGLAIFTLLLVLRFPLMILIGVFVLLFFYLLRSTKIIIINEQTVEAQLPFLESRMGSD